MELCYNPAMRHEDRIIDHETLLRLRPSVERKAAEIRAEDEERRARAASYGERVKPVSGRASDLFYTLLWGEHVTDPDHRPLDPTEVVPILREYVQTKILEANTRLAAPYDEDDRVSAGTMLARYSGISEDGNAGLVDF